MNKNKGMEKKGVGWGYFNLGDIGKTLRKWHLSRDWIEQFEPYPDVFRIKTNDNSNIKNGRELNGAKLF